MGSAIYNAAIPNMHRALLAVLACRIFLFAAFLVLVTGRPACASDASTEQQLAKKIAGVTGPGTVAITLENRSSLPRRDIDAASQRLRAAMETLGIRFVDPDRAAATVAIVFSENSSSYVWVAEIRQGTGEPAVVLVTAPRGESAPFTRQAVPLTLRKVPLWSQPDRILDVAVLEEAGGAGPNQIAVLDGEEVSLYRMKENKWQQEQVAMLAHSRPWPRDLRGRLVPAKDHLLDAYLPGVYCRSAASAPLSLSCHESDDPWPLVASANVVFPSFGRDHGAPTAPALAAFFAPARNFFTGALAPGVGKFKTVPKFYSAAYLPREKYALWLFSSVDGQLHMLDGVTDVAVKLGWGSDLASLRSSCGAGWQLLVSSSDSTGQSVRAYEIPDREPVPVSAAIDLPGELTALWTEATGDSAVAVVRNRESGNYEAIRLAVACNQ